MSNKKGLNFLVIKEKQGQCSDVEEEGEEESYDHDDNDDKTRGSYDDEFVFLQHDAVRSIWEKAGIPKVWLLGQPVHSTCILKCLFAD